MWYLVQIRKEGNGYLTRCSTDVWTQALMYYRSLNIVGYPCTKRLVEVCEGDSTRKFKVIARSKGL